MGAAKAGVSLVTFSEKNDADSLHQTLRDSGARGMIFSPKTQVNDNGDNRATLLEKLMPELNKLYPGDSLKLKNYPALK